MAVAIAKSMNLSVVVVPNKDNAEDFHKESENIYLKMLPFYSKLETISFEEKETVLAENWDVVRELKEGRFDASLWGKMAASKLTPSFEGLRRYQQLEPAVPFRTCISATMQLQMKPLASHQKP